MRFFLIIIMLFIYSKSVAQNMVSSEFYELNLPELSSLEKINSTNEAETVIDVFKIINSENNQIKYLVYLMSNKLNVEINKLSDLDIEDFLQDIGQVEILEQTVLPDKSENFYKLKIQMDSNKGIFGIAYLTHMNDVLYRVIFMIPENNYSTYLNEVDTIFKSITFKKRNWGE